MKKYITMFAVLLAFGIAKAQDSTTSETPDTAAPTSEAPTTPPAATAPRAHVKTHEAKRAAKAEKQNACSSIKKACEAAGFHKNEHKNAGKGLYKDCLDPTLAGTPPAGVTATEEEINACKAHKATIKHEEHKGKGKGHGKEHHEDAPAGTTAAHATPTP